MIHIKNTQRKIKISTTYIKQTAQNILTELGYQDFDLGIWLTTSVTIRVYNRDFRNKDKPTDILSFPYHYGLKPGQKIKVVEEEDKNVGDIIIALDFVEGLLPLYNVTLKERVSVLLVHGICHLLGYTHYDEDNDEKMSTLERKIAKKLGIKNT